MLIDPQLRQRILRSLRWLVRDTQYRFDDQKQNIEPGSQGSYSDELTEAIQLLHELEQGTMLSSETARPHSYTEQECKDVGYLLGMSDREVSEFYAKYGCQGWVLGNGLPIVDLKLAMRQWQLRNNKDAPEQVKNKQGKTPRQLDIERRGC
jgi:hypothetical protein